MPKILPSKRLLLPFRHLALFAHNTLFLCTNQGDVVATMGVHGGAKQLRATAGSYYLRSPLRTRRLSGQCWIVLPVAILAAQLFAGVQLHPFEHLCLWLGATGLSGATAFN